MAIKLTEESKEALKFMKDKKHHVFLTGRAGTGKSTLLREFQTQMRKKVVILAPTGIAAINVMGETIHSFFGFTPKTTLFSAIKRAKKLKEKEKKMYDRVQAIVIDEVSMVRADLMDYMDRFLRNALDVDIPFGGKKMIFIGDLYQLPPVLTNAEKDEFLSRYKTPYFFSSEVMKEMFVDEDMPIKYIELTKVYRQVEEGFIYLLNAVRDGSLDWEDLSALNQRVLSSPPLDFSGIHLTATNKLADEENEVRLDELDGITETFIATVKGKIEEKNFPAKEDLDLKIGARVMFVNNDSEGHWQNGTLATVKDFDGAITVQMDNGRIQKVLPHTWEMYHTELDEDTNELKQKILGTFTQYPLKLAWAITIHKSQGQTFDSVFIDLGWGAFAEGQTYVALSRCKTYRGLFLRKPLRMQDIKVDDMITAFLNVMRQVSV